MRRKKDCVVESVGAWEQIVQGREAESFSRGSLIYRPDQPARDLLLLIGGQVGLYLLSSEGRALTLRVMEPHAKGEGYEAGGHPPEHRPPGRALDRVPEKREAHAAHQRHCGVGVVHLKQAGNRR